MAIPMSKIEFVANIIDDHFKEDDIRKLKEVQADMEVDFISDGQRYLTFTFDKNLSRREYPKGLFPFFTKGIAELNSFCDYLIFAEKESKLYVLLIELKKGNSKVTVQLNASKCFTDYLIATINRVFNQQIIPEIRLISIRERHIKPKQKQKEVEYDVNNFHTFSSSKFRLKSYLK
jgi:hypothetical protein